jgi:hypothetical protein
MQAVFVDAQDTADELRAMRCAARLHDGRIRRAGDVTQKRLALMYI